MKKLLLLFTMLLSVAAASGQREPYPIQDLARPALGGTAFSVKGHNINVEVHPSGTGSAYADPTFAEEGDTVTIAIVPEQNYMLESIEAYYYNWLTQHTIPTTQLNDSTYSFIMVDHEVTVEVNFKHDETPIVGDIETPEPICSGHPLELEAPSVENAEQQGWIMSNDNFTTHVEAYDGQPLTLSHDGWALRYMASNSLGGIAFSNTVTITIQGFDGVVIEGDTQVIVHEQGSYKITGAPIHSSFVWTVSDESAIVEEPSLNERLITWMNPGIQLVTVVVTETSSGCTDTLSMEVEVGACIDEDDINAIEAKKHEGKEYILIYPNPKDNYYYQWYLNDGMLEGETDQYLYREGGLGSGKYKVRLSLFENGTCWAETEEYEIGRGNMVYPNLLNSGSNLVVVKDREGEAQFELYAIDGRLVFNQKLTDQATNISLNLPKGIYVAYIINQTSYTKTEKIVVQ